MLSTKIDFTQANNTRIVFWEQKTQQFFNNNSAEMQDDIELFIQDQVKHRYVKSDVIPVDPRYMYLVLDGLIKLSTFLENGDELIIGFAGTQMMFGSCLSSLQTYQVRAFSKTVTVAVILLEEINSRPYVAQYFFPKSIRLIQQSQLFLSIHGYRHIPTRLYNLLLLLKKEFGQPVAQGILINIRLTHNDLASICATTRVTITRLINEFEKQGIIAFDRNKCIILLDSMQAPPINDIRY